MLTAKQYELLMFIHKRSSMPGPTPSYEEMRRELGLRSRSSVHRLVSALQRRGYIRRIPHCARAVEIVRLPQSQESRFREPTAQERTAQGPEAVRSPRAKGESRSREPDLIVDDLAGGQNESVRRVPLMGKIAAGTPIEAIQTMRQIIPAPGFLLGAGEHFALSIVGDSMKDCGILDGDVVILRKGDDADSGDIVVALIDGVEATLKRFHRHGASIALEAINADYDQPTRIYGAGRVVVQGKLQALFRRC